VPMYSAGFLTKTERYYLRGHFRQVLKAVPQFWRRTTLATRILDLLLCPAMSRSRYLVVSTETPSIGKAYNTGFRTRQRFFYTSTIRGFGGLRGQVAIPKDKIYAAMIASGVSSLPCHLHPATSTFEIYSFSGPFDTVPGQAQMILPSYLKAKDTPPRRLPLLRQRRRESVRIHAQNDLTEPYPNWLCRSYHRLSSVTAPHPARHTLQPSHSRERRNFHLCICEMITEKELFNAWREKNGYGVRQMERELTENDRFLSMAVALNSDGSLGTKMDELVEKEHTTRKKVLIVVSTEDEGISLHWGVSKCAKAWLKVLSDGRVAIWAALSEA